MAKFSFNNKMGEEVVRELRTDVLVVGAGPAGGMAALELASKGVRVLLVDRYPFPREKTCGDGLLEDSLKILTEAGLGAAVRERAHSIGCIRFCAPNGSECVVEGDICTLRRSELDAIIVEHACRRGGQFHDGIQITGPLLRGGSLGGAVGVDHEGRKVRIAAKLVLLATGSNPRLLSAFGVLESKGPSAIGIRGYFRLRDTIDENTMIVSYDPQLLPGYGWIFPLGAGIFNVGCGIHLDGRQRVPRFGSNLTRFYQHVQPMSKLLRRAERISPMRAATMRTGFRGAQACAPGLLVLGEALGLTFPFIGEGISNALESGRLASSVAIAALGSGNLSSTGLRRYERELRQILQRRHQGYLAAQRWFRLKPFANMLIEKAARSQSVRGVARQILTGETDAAEVFSLRGIARVFLLR
ncbi:MAG: NAD(P)/FAD-dependent oxidoreductase [Deltaproteobacteria bacterium]|nr:MAG: NAD(P)/FAD-dependent oxidoreductase [Deltaproteobacteria bacterium]